MMHWKGCLCGSCAASFKVHNASGNLVVENGVWVGGIVVCGCKFCKEHYYEGMKSRQADEVYHITKGEQRAMASLNMCEREGCNALVKGLALGGVTVTYSLDNRGTNIPIDQTIRRLELCPACVEDVHNVITTQPLAKRQKAYDKPFNPTAEEVHDDLSDVDTEHLAAVLLQRTMKNAARQIEGETK